MPRDLRTIGIDRTIRFSLFLLLVVTIVARSGAHRTNDGGGSLAYGSASASASAYASAGASASALSNANAFNGIGGFPGAAGSHDGHKGIRSYDNTGYGGNNQPHGGVKGNRGSGCQKCKWEDDDYWEKEEEETEPEEKDEDDCGDGDDGQYREHGRDHGHGSNRGSPQGVQKLGATNPFGQGQYTAGVGSAATNVGSGATPVKGGYPGNGGPSSGSPWNKPSPGVGTYGPGQPSNRQLSSGWHPDSTVTPKSSWKEGHGSPTPGRNSHPSGSWNGGSLDSPHTGASNPSDGSWNNGPETGSGCFGSYQLATGTGCAQGTNVHKQGPSGYPSNPAGNKLTGQTGSHENPTGPSYGSTGQGQYPGSGPSQNSPFGPSHGSTGSSSPESNPSSPSYGPITGQGSHPGSDSSHSNPFGPSHGPTTGQGKFLSSGPSQQNSPFGPSHGSTGEQGQYPGSESPKSDKGRGRGSNPHQNTNAATNAGSSSVAYAAAGSAAPGNSFEAAHPINRAPSSSPSHAPGRNSPFGNTGEPSFPNSPSTPGIKGGPFGSGTGSGSRSMGTAPGEPNSGNRDKAKDGDSKIFYINVNPVPGSPAGIKPHATTPKPTYQPSSSLPDKTIGGSDYSQDPRQVIPGGNGEPFNGAATETGNGCAPGVGGCASGPGSPSYDDKTGNVKKISGGAAGSYPWNPFLTSKLPNLPPGGPSVDTVTTNKNMIGQGNPFLQGTGSIGTAAGAKAWSSAGAAAAVGPTYAPTTEGGSTKPIGKDNPFLAGTGPIRGDIGVGHTPGGSSNLGLGSNGPNLANGNPFFNDKAHPGSDGTTNNNANAGWNAGPVNGGTSTGVKNPSATNRGSGSGGGVGVGGNGFGSFPGQSGHGNPFGVGFSGAISSAQASSYANSNAGAPAAAFGQANSGSWASSGANAASQAGSGSWSSSGASAYASSSASSWAGAGPLPAKR